MTLFNGQQGQRCKGKAERPLLRSCDFCYTIVGELASILNHRKCNDGRMSPECHSIHSNYLSPSLSFHHFLISRFIFNDFLSLFLTHSHTLHFYSIISVENTREKTFLEVMKCWCHTDWKKWASNFCILEQNSVFFWGLVKDSSGQWVLIKQLWSFKFETC